MATDKQRPLVTIVALVAVALVLLVVLALIFWPAEEPEPEPQAPEPTQLPEPEPQPAPATEGLGSDGRAVNDPRVQAQPVGRVDITTTHPELFGADVAPPVSPPERVTPRAANDPRGRRENTAMEKVASQ